MIRFFIAFVLLGFGCVFAQSEVFIHGSYLEEDLLLNERIFLGNIDAPISVVVFEDFGCPHCQDFNQNIFPTFKETYIDTGFVKLYFLQLPIPVSDYSEMAALASECVAEQNTGAFWLYKTALYGTSIKSSRYGPSVTFNKFWRIAESIGAEDQGAFMSCVLEERYVNKIQQDRELGINAGVRSTPSMLIDTEAILNPLDYDLLSRVLNGYVDSLE